MTDDCISNIITPSKVHSSSILFTPFMLQFISEHRGIDIAFVMDAATFSLILCFFLLGAVFIIYLCVYVYVSLKLISDSDYRSPTSRAEIQLKRPTVDVEYGIPVENNKSEPKRLESRDVSRETRSPDTTHQPIKPLYPVLDTVETTIVPQLSAEESLGHQLRESPQVSREDLVSRAVTQDTNVDTVHKLCDDTAEDYAASTLQHPTFKDAISTEVETGKSIKEIKEPLLPSSAISRHLHATCTGPEDAER